MKVRRGWRLWPHPGKPLDEPRQRIMTSHSIGKLTNNLGEIREVMQQHGQRGAEKLRSQGSLAQAVLVFLKSFRQDLPQYSPCLAVELSRSYRRRPGDTPRRRLRAAAHLPQGLPVSEGWREAAGPYRH